MRKFSAAMIIIMMLCPCAFAEISRETAESAWRRMCEADGFRDLPINFENDSSPNAWVSFRSQNDFSIHVSSGLMEILNTEDEIAGVLGHEIGHVKRGHYTRGRNRAVGWGIADNLLGQIGGRGGNIARNVGRVGIELAESGFSREEEVEADDYGSELLRKAGYDPYGLYNAMKALADNNFITQPSGFSSHPPTERRLQHLLAKAEESGPEILTASKPEPKTPKAPKKSSTPRKTAAKTSTRTSTRTPTVTPERSEENAVTETPTPVLEENVTVEPTRTTVTIPVQRTALTRTALPATLRPAPRPTPRQPAVRPAERLSVQPGGVVLQGARSYRGAVMSAYQRAYAMNFEIWRPVDLPAGWYATFDGFPVAQVAENRWVYGQMNKAGTIQPTDILVGSVIPSRVPGLVRIAALWSWGKDLSTPEFLSIREKRVNRMGWLNTETVNTIVAWHTQKAGMYIWLGDKWRKFEPHPGEYTWQMIRRLSPYIADELRKNNAYFYGGEPLEVADLARQWGFIWGGRVVLESIRHYGYDGGRDHRDSGTTTSLSSESGNQSETPSEPQETNQNEGQWDVD